MNVNLLRRKVAEILRNHTHLHLPSSLYLRISNIILEAEQQQAQEFNPIRGMIDTLTINFSNKPDTMNLIQFLCLYSIGVSVCFWPPRILFVVGILFVIKICNLLVIFSLKTAIVYLVVIIFKSVMGDYVSKSD